MTYLTRYLVLRPDEVEKESFLLITRNFIRGRSVIPYNHAPIVLRCIHTSADYDFCRESSFLEKAVPMAHKALLSGACIVSDTRMGLDGMKRELLKYSAEYRSA
jgi:precorrin-8X/cobalt-precorrin-8 methylmutase